MGQDEEEQYITTEYMNELEAEMMEAAEQLEFERAAAIRDRIMQLQDYEGEKLSQVEVELVQSPRQSPRVRRRARKCLAPARKNDERPTHGTLAADSCHTR